MIDETGLLKHRLAVFGHNEVRNAHHVELLRQGGPALRIHLKDDSLPCHFLGDLFYFGRRHAAWTTPCGPEVDQHRNASTLYDLIEGLFIDLEGRCQRWKLCFAGAAVSSVRYVLSRNAILLTARRTLADHDG